MTVAEILNSVKFIVDPDGRQSAVVVDLDVWEQILSLLEDAEDAEEIKRGRSVKKEAIPWKVAKKGFEFGGMICTKLTCAVRHTGIWKPSPPIMPA